MGLQQQLHTALKSDIGAISEPLFDLSVRLLAKRTGFLPHGAVLASASEVLLLGGAPEDGDRATPEEILPLVHEGLARSANSDSLAVAVCEDVTITLADGKPTLAIKVLIEHRFGLCIALYLPYTRSMFGKLREGQIFALPCPPEVNPFRDVEPAIGDPSVIEGAWRSDRDASAASFALDTSVPDDLRTRLHDLFGRMTLTFDAGTVSSHMTAFKASPEFRQEGSYRASLVSRDVLEMTYDMPDGESQSSLHFFVSEDRFWTPIENTRAREYYDRIPV